MSSVSKEQISAARQIDLLSYLLANEPDSVKKSGPGEYCLAAEHPSLKISNGQWHWWSQGIGGKDALKFLVSVRGVPFTQAVERLTAGSTIAYTAPIRKPPPRASKPFSLPLPNWHNAAVTAYLLGRGIDRELINHCISTGALYESKKGNNCVFVGKDAQGQTRFACQRGTGTVPFKGDVQGSDKRIGFCLNKDPAGKTLAICESAIDALSLATLHKSRTDNWQKCHYLSLSGTTPLAALQYLKDHREITRVYLCLDNDSAGLEGTLKLKEAIQAESARANRNLEIIDQPPRQGKDYNEQLQNLRALEQVPYRPRQLAAAR